MLRKLSWLRRRIRHFDTAKSYLDRVSCAVIYQINERCTEGQSNSVDCRVCHATIDAVRIRHDDFISG